MNAFIFCLFVSSIICTQPTVRLFENPNIIINPLTIQAYTKRSQYPSVPPQSLGPFQVGETSDVIMDVGRNGGGLNETWLFLPYTVDPTMGGTGRAWTFTIYYPASSFYINATTPKFNTRGVPAFAWESVGLLCGYDSVPVANGQFPLMIFSPGHGGDSFVYQSQGYQLASYGYIVVMIDFVPGDNSFIFQYDPNNVTGIGYMLAFTERAIDISHTLTKMLNRSETLGDLFYHRINENEIIASGHSYGGLAALSLVVGPENIRGTGFNVTVDERITALVLQDPSDWQLPFSELKRNHVPTLVMTSKQSHGFCGLRAFYAGRHGANAKVKISNSVHLSFADDVCLAALLFGINPADFFPNCDPSQPIAQYSTVMPIIKGYMTAFLELLIEDNSYLPYFNVNCAAFISNGTFELWNKRAGNVTWTPPQSVVDNLAYGSDVDYLNDPSADITDGNFKYYQNMVAHEPQNCSIPALV